MKQGNQFYLDVKLKDSNGEYIDINSVDVISFQIGNITKRYPKEVSYELGGE